MSPLLTIDRDSLHQFITRLSRHRGIKTTTNSVQIIRQEITTFVLFRYSVVVLIMSDITLQAGDVHHKPLEEEMSNKLTDDESSESLHPLLEEYYELVARIEILRDRLTDLEFTFREGNPQDDLSSSSDMKAHPSRQFADDVGRWKITQRVRSRHKIDTYLRMRQELTNELLQTIAAAAKYRDHYIAELGTVHSEDKSNAWEEAVKYDHEESYGNMYAIMHDGQHRGIRPIDVVLIPHLHREERILHWIRNVHLETARLSQADVQDFTSSSSSPKQNFIVFHDKLQGYKRSSNKRCRLGNNEVPEISPLLWTAPKTWRAWAGEYSQSSRPSSEPQALHLVPDSFAAWGKLSYKSAE